MPIAIEHAHDKSEKKRRLATTNLRLLLTHLRPSHLCLIENVGVKFVFVSAAYSGASDYTKRTIELNVKEFCQFQYSERPSRNQRWCLSTLKEEVIHYLAAHTGFDRSRAWKRAAALDTKSHNSLRDSLFVAQREFDSSSKEIKLLPHEYAAAMSPMEKIINLLHGKWEPASELLVDLLLVKDYLSAKNLHDDEIDRIMRAAFGASYPLALSFEASLDELAAQYR